MTEGTFGRYQVIRHLASGGMAQVLLARVTGIEGFERYVVVKRIHRERAHDEAVVKMFLDEARLAASLHHQNIVQVHDIGQERGEYFFAMEYVHGEDLRAVLNKLNKQGARMPLEHVLTVVASAAAGLHYAHDHRGPDRKPLNIVHRDVSPANILVGYDGQVKVVDFGIAKAALRSSETQSGTLKGKISYMAPEHCMGNAVDRRSDVFALGIVLFELFTVRRLFKGANDFLTMTEIVQGNIPKPSVHRPDIAPELENIILKALAMDPGQRFQTAEELRLALEEFGRSAGARSSSAALGDYMVSQFGRRPEPWLVDDDDGAVETMEVDFDGAAEPGSKPARPRIPTPPHGSPLARARRKIALATGVEVPPIPPQGPPASVTEAPPASANDGAATAGDVAASAVDSASSATDHGWNANGKAQTTASGTPMAWTPQAPPEAPAASKRIGKRVLAALVAIPVVVGIGVVATRSADEPRPAAAPRDSKSATPAPSLGTTPAPTLGATRAPRPEPAPSKSVGGTPQTESSAVAPPAPAVSAEQPASPAGPPRASAAPSVDKDKTASKPAKKRRAKSASAPAGDPKKWNPDSLFLRPKK